jgi:hypothetical protein
MVPDPTVEADEKTERKNLAGRVDRNERRPKIPNVESQLEVATRLRVRFAGGEGLESRGSGALAGEAKADPDSLIFDNLVGTKSHQSDLL